MLKMMMIEVKAASLTTVVSLKHQLKNTNKKKLKEGNRIKGKNMAMLVFNPCIMVFSPLFNVIMLTLTVLTRIDRQSFDELQIGQNTTNCGC
jgi:hypothetical protein